MDMKLIEGVSLRYNNMSLPILPSVICPYTTAEAIEDKVKQLIVTKRRSMGLKTVFDNNLSYILSPALEVYENERVSSMHMAGSEEFQHAVKRCVPIGYSFKGFPIMFNHTDTNRMLDALQEGAVPCDIMQSVGDRVSF